MMLIIFHAAAMPPLSMQPHASRHTRRRCCCAIDTPLPPAASADSAAPLRYGFAAAGVDACHAYHAAAITLPRRHDAFAATIATTCHAAIDFDAIRYAMILPCAYVDAPLLISTRFYDSC